MHQGLKSRLSLIFLIYKKYFKKNQFQYLKNLIIEDDILKTNRYIQKEIDESKIISNNNVIYRIFDIVYKSKKIEYLAI